MAINVNETGTLKSLGDMPIVIESFAPTTGGIYGSHRIITLGPNESYTYTFDFNPKYILLRGNVQTGQCVLLLASDTNTYPLPDGMTASGGSTSTKLQRSADSITFTTDDWSSSTYKVTLRFLMIAI